jgi:glycine oxidase
MSSTARDVIVVGGGAIGAAVAWRCAQRGLRVAMVDAGPTRLGAWHTAAGMLAPVTELHYAETALLRLNLDSLARYPGFAAELTDRTGLPTGFSACGTVSVAWDGADLAALRELCTFGATLGLDGRLLTGRELRALEPAIAPGLPGGLLAEHDHQVDPRLLHAALTEAGATAGVTVHHGVAALRTARERVTGVHLADGTDLPGAVVVLAAGAWSARVDGLPSDAVPRVRPVKGQTLRLTLPGPSRLAHVLRGSVKGVPVYIVPRGLDSPDAERTQYVVGASAEEVGFDLQPRAGAVYELLRDAQSLMPELSEAVLAEVCTGLRPGSPDNAPLVGRAGPEGLILATGHHRNGILLTPVTADGVADLITVGAVPDVLAPFAPTRDLPAAEAAARTDRTKDAEESA